VKKDVRLKDRVAIVTGAGSGIGRASAIRFAQEGARVVVVDWDAQSGAETAQRIRDAGGEAVFVRADVSQVAGVEKFVNMALECWGRLDVLFNNAGIGLVGLVHETSEADFDRVVGVNLKGVFLGCKYVLPIMMQQRSGSIINTASELALVGSWDYHVYSATKGAVHLLTRSMAKAYAQYNIRVNCICPGPIDTPLLEKAIRDSPDPERERRLVVEMVPMKRLGQPEEVANVALFLASDEASFVTGAAYVVDGGAIA